MLPESSTISINNAEFVTGHNDATLYMPDGRQVNVTMRQDEDGTVFVYVDATHVEFDADGNNPLCLTLGSMCMEVRTHKRWDG